MQSAAKQAFKRAPALLLILVILFEGCAYTVPSRARGATIVYPFSYYRAKAAILPFTDKRPVEMREVKKKITWPGWQGKVDYYGERVPASLAAAIQEYLSAANVFFPSDPTEVEANEEYLRMKGYRVVLTGDLEEFACGFSTNKILLALPFLLIPGSGLLLMVWPKEIRFIAVLSNLALKDLVTNRVLWSGRIEIRDQARKVYFHITPKWFLGETGELVAKELVRELMAAKLKFA